MRKPVLRRRAVTALLYSALVLFAVWVLFPFWFLVNSSFMTPQEAVAVPPHWIPEAPTLGNYEAILAGKVAPGGAEVGLRVMTALGESFAVGLLTVAVNLALGGTAAYSMSRYRYRGSRLSYLAVLFARLVPAIAIVAAFFVALRNLGLIDTRYGLVIVYTSFTLPITILLLKNYFDGLPRALDEAALVDGATRLQALWYVIRPIARPGFIAAACLVFLESWGEFFFALTLTNQLTMPPVLAGFRGFFQFNWTTLAAATVLAVVPPVVLALVFQRYVVRGLAQGVTK